MPVSTLVRRNPAMPYNPAYSPQLNPQQPLLPPPTPFDASMAASSPLWGTGIGEAQPRSAQSVIAGLYNQNPYWIRGREEMPPIPAPPVQPLELPTPQLAPMDVEPPGPLPPELMGVRDEMIPLPPPRPATPGGGGGPPASPQSPVTAGAGGVGGPPLPPRRPAAMDPRLLGGGSLAEQLALMSRLTRENTGGNR